MTKRVGAYVDDVPLLSVMFTRNELMGLIRLVQSRIDVAEGKEREYLSGLLMRLRQAVAG